MLPKLVLDFIVYEFLCKHRKKCISIINNEKNVHSTGIMIPKKEKEKI